MFEKLAEGACFLQPLGGGAFAAGATHSADDVAESLGALACAEAGFFEDFRDLELLEGFQGDVFGADGAGVDQLQGVDIELLEFLGLPDF